LTQKLSKSFGLDKNCFLGRGNNALNTLILTAFQENKPAGNMKRRLIDRLLFYPTAFIGECFKRSCSE
jgi:hypothetical protein